MWMPAWEDSHGGRPSFERKTVTREKKKETLDRALPTRAVTRACLGCPSQREDRVWMVLA